MHILAGYGKVGQVGVKELFWLGSLCHVVQTKMLATITTTVWVSYSPPCLGSESV